MMAALVLDCVPRRFPAMLVATALALVATVASAAQDAALSSALRSDSHVVLLRHAVAPGTGDPENFALGDCSTQRNLSQAGREQAARIGRRLRASGLAQARVYASQWCRAQETARLLGLGPVTELPLLNSFFQRGDRQEEQTRMLVRWLARQDLSRPLVLVTHQVNITALARIYPASGEMVLMRRTEDGNMQVVGTAKTE
jgi:phosphohistidine phosphatase SixA